VLPSWALVSSSQSDTVAMTEEVEALCEEIYRCFRSGLDFFEDLSRVSPWNLVLLDYCREPSQPSDIDIGVLIEDIEVSLFEWALDKLVPDRKLRFRRAPD
jgi:hypothetical protein